MKKTLAVLVGILTAAGSFSFAFATGSWTLTATCGDDGTLHYVTNSSGGNDYYLAFQGIVGNSTQINGSLHVAGGYDQVSTCGQAGDVGKIDPLSYWFAAVVPAANQGAWVTYLTSGGSQPSGDYGLSLCTTFACTNLITTSLGATSTALGHLQDVSASSTLAQIQDQCSDGNFFTNAICVSFSYLFIPSEQTLNDFASLASTSAAKFPISWFYGVRTALSQAQATSTSNMSDISFNLASVGLGSTTAIGNVLPNVEVFSTSTITHFMPSGVWTAIQAFMSAALWIGLMTYIWYSSKNLFHV